MIQNGECFMIREMKQKGMNITQIADELGRDRKTVRKWLEKKPEGYQRTTTKPGKLDPFQDYIRQRMEEGCLNAVVLFDEIKAKGYTGKETLLRNFMRPLRPAVATKATERFETPPGKQAQVDWGQVTVDWDGKKKRLYAFVMVLGYSRMMYVEFTEDERLDTLMGCHLRAMQYFGGRTETCLYDNMKTVVRGLDEKGEVVWNDRFAAFAHHHGFQLRRCQPYRARTKGKVENGVGYVKKNFWPRVRSFTGLHDLNLQARLWMDRVANVRIHGTTHEKPGDRWRDEGLEWFNLTPFEQVERHVRRVSNDALVSFEANRYSVPHAYIGQVIHVQDDKNGTLHFYHGDEEIAHHDKQTGKHQAVINREHFKGIRKTSHQKVRQPHPRLVSEPAPDVTERSLSFYDQFIEERVKI
jgi:transposase